MDAAIYDYAGTLQGTATGIDAADFPLRVQIRFGVEITSTDIDHATHYQNVSNVVGTHDTTTLFTDGFSGDGGLLGSTAPSPWTYADTDKRRSSTLVDAQGSFSGSELQFSASRIFYDGYAVAWSWISKEDILIPLPATATTYRFTWDIDTDYGLGLSGGARGTGIDSDGSPYPDDPFEMLINGFNVFSAQGSSEPFSPYGDFFFGPDFGMIPSFTSSPFNSTWGYTIVFTDVTSGLHVWQRV